MISPSMIQMIKFTKYRMSAISNIFFLYKNDYNEKRSSGSLKDHSFIKAKKQLYKKSIILTIENSEQIGFFKI